MELSMTNWISLVGGALVQQIPNFLVICAGLAYCFLNLRKSPKASKTALIGLLILFFVHIAALFLPVIFTQMAFSMRDNIQTVGMLNMAIGFVYSLIGAVGLGFVIYAVWIGRKEE